MRLLLLLLCIFEVLLYTWWQNVAGLIWSPVIIMLVSCSIGLLSLKLSTSRRGGRGPTKIPWAAIINVILFAGLTVWLFQTLTAGFHRIALGDPLYSDVILTHQHQARNFVAGRPAYEPFANVTYVIAPSYLPFQWLPYVLAEWWHIDYRWIAVLSTWLASLAFMMAGIRRARTDNILWAALVPVWPLLVYATLVKSGDLNFLITLESLSAGYYLMLVMFLDKNNWILMAVFLSICLLSRMSVALWVPLCIGIYLVSGQTKKALLIAGCCVLFVAIFYLPFLLTTPSLLHPYERYSAAITGIWNRKALMNGLAFNSWGMMFLKGDAEHQVAIYNKIHFWACISTVAALGLYYLLKARKKYAVNSYLLFSLKIYLTVFYTFIQLPFDYLFIIPMIVTSALLSHVLLPAEVVRNS